MRGSKRSNVDWFFALRFFGVCGRTERVDAEYISQLADRFEIHPATLA